MRTQKRSCDPMWLNIHVLNRGEQAQDPSHTGSTRPHGGHPDVVEDDVSLEGQVHRTLVTAVASVPRTVSGQGGAQPVSEW